MAASRVAIQRNCTTRNIDKVETPYRVVLTATTPSPIVVFLMRRLFSSLFVNILPLLFLLSLSTLLSAEQEPQPDFTLMIPMRDGVELPTDIYLPSIEAEKLPCILLRCPAGRKAYPWRNYAQLAKLGYAVAMQDTRSALDKEGKSIPYWTDGWGSEKDGYDTVEWLASSNYTNGRIGTIGFSAVGITQQMMAPSAPPSLKCQYIGVAAGSIYHHAAFPGGQLLKNQVEGWLGLYAKDPSIYSYLCSQPHYNEFWQYFDAISQAHRITAPAIHYGGWYDTFIQGTIDSFVSRQEKGGAGAKGKQKLVIGPWTHYWPDSMALGDFQVPENAQHMPEPFTPHRWFAHHLKGEEQGYDQVPPVTYYLMGPLDGTPSSGNVWKHANSWPVPSVQLPFYLNKENRLTLRTPEVDNLEYSYQYDPENPVPTVGGRNLFIESGPKDQRSIEMRDDVITFTTPPLKKELEITGHLFATLYFSSDCDDTDLAVRLTDVYPDGRSILIADSIYRTGGRDLTEEEELNEEEGKPKELQLDLWSTSVLIAKGHRIRLSVSSSNYPRFEKNVNKGRKFIHLNDPVVANNKVHIGKNYPSRVILPIVKR